MSEIYDSVDALFYSWEDDPGTDDLSGSLADEIDGERAARVHAKNTPVRRHPLIQQAPKPPRPVPIAVAVAPHRWGPRAALALVATSLVVMGALAGVASAVVVLAALLLW